ncbi:MAG: HD domain-containing response regulator [Bacillota bacterium]|nr:HD domain-containing response regulator [Bacillota bacterium]
MRKNRTAPQHTEFSMLVLDDDELMTLTLQSYFQASGYRVDIENDPYAAIRRIRDGNYDILLLDFLMTPICGDQVVEEIRQFNQDLFIILLTGHKSMAPPIKTIRELDIQGYYEKSDRFDQLELLVESCGKSIRQMDVIRSYQSGLRSMLEAMPLLYSLRNFNEIAAAIVERLNCLANCREGFVYVDSTRFTADGAPIMSEERFLCFDSKEGPPMKEEDLLSHMRTLEGVPFHQQGYLATAPLLDEGGQVTGFLGVRFDKPLKDYQLQLLELYARQTAAALDNAALHFLLNRKNQELTSAYDKLRDSYLEIVSAMRLIVDAKDIYTRGHSDRVSYYAHRIAMAMGRDEEFCRRVRVAGLFHDIGKIGIADDILLSRERLTPEQFQVIMEHPQNGHEILSAISLFRDILPAVRNHHERYSGRGYPDGLTQESIPEEARIIAVADAFDAMTSDRHYRPKLKLEKAMEELENGRGTQFDPEIARIFLELLKDYPAMEAELAWTHLPRGSASDSIDI